MSKGHCDGAACVDGGRPGGRGVLDQGKYVRKEGGVHDHGIWPPVCGLHTDRLGGATATAGGGREENYG